MQSTWFVGFVLFVACGFSKAVPIAESVDQLSNDNNDSETRLIVPPEMTSNFHELLRSKSENSTKSDKVESIPLNFLRSSDDSQKKVNQTDDQKPLMSFDGTKQAPIFITIPIYITSDRQAMPIISTSIEQIVPIKMPPPKMSTKEGAIKIEEKKPQEPTVLPISQ